MINFSNFINNLDSNSLYYFIPIIKINFDLNNPYIVLSNSILISKFSDYRLIHYYVYNKFNQSINDFKLDRNINYLINLKYVYIIKIINIYSVLTLILNKIKWKYVIKENIDYSVFVTNSIKIFDI